MSRLRFTTHALLDTLLWLLCYMVFFNLVFPILQDGIAHTGADQPVPVKLAMRIAYVLSLQPVFLVILTAIGLGYHAFTPLPPRIGLGIKLISGLLFLYLMCFLSLPVVWALRQAGRIP